MRDTIDRTVSPLQRFSEYEKKNVSLISEWPLPHKFLSETIKLVQGPESLIGPMNYKSAWYSYIWEKMKSMKITTASGI